MEGANPTLTASLRASTSRQSGHRYNDGERGFNNSESVGPMRAARMAAAPSKKQGATSEMQSLITYQQNSIGAWIHISYEHKFRTLPAIRQVFQYFGISDAPMLRYKLNSEVNSEI